MEIGKMDQVKIGKFISERRKKQGLLQKDIAARLGISEKTVRNHISNNMQKLGIKGRAQAVVELLKMNIISL